MPDQIATLARVLESQKGTILSRWQAGVSEMPAAAKLDPLTLRDHLPQFLNEMLMTLRRRAGGTVGDFGAGSPLAHGLQRHASGFDIKEVVAEYNTLRSTVLDLAEESGLNLRAADCRVINHIIDAAIAGAVEAYSSEQAAELQRRREEHLAFIAHDIRTPLNAIALAVTGMELDSEPLNADAADMLDILRRNVRRIDDLIQRVLQEEGEGKSTEGMQLFRRSFDLWPVVQGMLEDVRPVTEAASVRVRNLVPHNLIVHADAGLLSRALQNLVGNSVKFAPGGEIEVGAAEKGGAVECWVTDNGIGIEPERRERIFEKRETDGDPSRAGFGMGLTIFKEIVDAHGGEIAIESAPDCGATFRFTIPAFLPAVQEPAG